MKQIFRMLDQRILWYLTSVLIILIPLYPKFPLIGLNGTYISIRLEDYYLALLTIILAIQIVRKKFLFPMRMTRLIMMFWIACIASYLVNTFITGTILAPKLGLAHTLRRVEYMIPFFLAYAAVRYTATQTHAHRSKLALKLLDVSILVVFLACLYAMGQKFSSLFEPLRAWLGGIYALQMPVISSIAYFFFRFFDFPAVQTMNAEFAKGALVNLTPFARVSSTFAGHYDLAAYLVFFIPILATYIIAKRKFYFATITFSMAILTLIFTASRISFGAYIVSMVALLTYLKQPRLLLFTFLLTSFFMLTNRDMTQRLQDTFKKRQIFENTRTGALMLNQNEHKEQLPSGIGISIQVKDTVKPITTDKKALEDFRNKQIDIEVDEARKSGKNITRQEAESIVNTKYKELSDIVVKEVIAGDTSLTTRTQIEWPRAMRAFLHNPPFGAGPSAITESTDGDYFRWLGETGLFGTGFFIAILFTLVRTLLRSLPQTEDKTVSMLVYGFCFGVLALAVNALMIDVFEASKVAFTFWTLAGVYLGMQYEPSDVHTS